VSGWFRHYASVFDTVEINNSFYRLPEGETFARWREQAPPHFVYAVKASRFLTHMKKLKDPHDPPVRFSRTRTSSARGSVRSSNMEGSATGKIVVGPFFYVRFHFGTRSTAARMTTAGSTRGAIS
jgi:hypothetical protein